MFPLAPLSYLSLFLHRPPLLQGFAPLQTSSCRPPTCPAALQPRSRNLWPCEAPDFSATILPVSRNFVIRIQEIAQNKTEGFQFFFFIIFHSPPSTLLLWLSNSCHNIGHNSCHNTGQKLLKPRKHAFFFY